METQYTYTSLLKSEYGSLKAELEHAMPHLTVTIREDLGGVRYLVEIEHNTTDVENIQNILLNYEDEWTQLEVDNWLGGVEVESEDVEVFTLVIDSDFAGLQYYQQLFFEKGIASTVISSKLTIGPTYYSLQTTQDFLEPIQTVLAEIQKEELIWRGLDTEPLDSSIREEAKRGLKYYDLFTSFIYVPTPSYISMLENKGELMDKNIHDKIARNIEKYLLEIAASEE